MNKKSYVIVSDDEIETKNIPPLSTEDAKRVDDIIDQVIQDVIKQEIMPQKH